ncbi:MAG TPA: hypothetical protein VKV79_00940 [Terriglobia bacterium]|nr:hypothetical protein [Terriglobia bacterium]
MAKITDVTVTVRGMTIATAAEGEIVLPKPPLEATLVIDSPKWSVSRKDELQYLEQQCRVTAKAIGQPYDGTFTIVSITGTGGIKLKQA